MHDARSTCFLGTSSVLGVKAPGMVEMLQGTLRLVRHALPVGTGLTSQTQTQNLSANRTWYR